METTGSSHNAYRRSIWMYILIAYLFTWTSTISIYLLYKQGIITSVQLNILHAVGSLGPVLAAFICRHVYYPDVKGLASLRSGHISKPSLLLAVSPLLFALIGLFLYPLLDGRWLSFSDTKAAFQLTDTASYVAWILPFIIYPVFEEFGWRGYLLPLLQQRYTALTATMILTVIWATWHAPFFLFRFQFGAGMLIGFLLGIFMGSIVLTSIYNFSGGSVPACILFHLFNNISSALDKHYIVATVSSAFFVLAAYIVLKYKTDNLSANRRVTIDSIVS